MTRCADYLEMDRFYGYYDRANSMSKLEPRDQNVRQSMRMFSAIRAAVGSRARVSDLEEEPGIEASQGLAGRKLTKSTKVH